MDDDALVSVVVTSSWSSALGLCQEPWRWAGRRLLIPWSLAILALFAYISHVLIHNVTLYHHYFGFVSIFTVTAVNSASKPVIITSLVAIFLGSGCRLGRFVQQHQASIDKSLRAKLERNVRCVLLVLASIFLFHAGISLVDHQQNDELSVEHVFKNHLNLLGFTMVPFIGVLIALPLCFAFLVLHSFVHMAQILRRRAAKVDCDVALLKRDFICLSRLQNRASDLLGPYIAFTLLWVSFTLCLAAYYGVSASGLRGPRAIFGPEHMDARDRTRLQINIVYSTLQIAYALAHLSVLCVLGSRVNEETRAVVAVALCVHAVPAKLPHITAMTQRLMHQRLLSVQEAEWGALQAYWGVSVWRALLMERGLLSTLLSLVATYAILLLKIEAPQDPQATAPVANATL